MPETTETTTEATTATTEATTATTEATTATTEATTATTEATTATTEATTATTEATTATTEATTATTEATTATTEATTATPEVVEEPAAPAPVDRMADLVSMFKKSFDTMLSRSLKAAETKKDEGVEKINDKCEALLNSNQMNYDTSVASIKFIIQEQKDSFLQDVVSLLHTAQEETTDKIEDISAPVTPEVPASMDVTGDATPVVEDSVI